MLLDLAFPLPLPNPRDGGAVVLARDGTPLRAFADSRGVWRYPVRADAVSPLYLQALIGYEDRWFWRHPGINPYALARAGGQVVRYRRVVSGGSTLTMQVARILDPHPRDVGGKIRQLFRALQLEVHVGKRGILQLYLDHAPFGGAIEGVEAASWAYLGKPASRLSHAEAALLTVLPQAPSRLRPDRHPEAARAARDKVLARMATLGIWSAHDTADARVEPVVARSLQAPRLAPLLAQRLRSASPREARIASTIDLDLQRVVEDRVAAYFSTLPERTSAALLVVDNATMEARAYVGSLDIEDNARLGHVDMVRAWRSPGSTLKPFLYGMALDDGLIHSETLLVDAPQSFGDYRPGNFDAAFNGPIGAAEALRLSLNVPAVDLLDRLGPVRFDARLAHAGLRLKWPDGATPNLSMILGGTGAKLEDLVGAYASLARGGVSGRVRYTPRDPQVDRRVMSEGAAWIIRDILERTPRPGTVGDLFDTRGRAPLAWKTGTSYGYRDAWAIGATPAYTVGVWVGRPDGTPMPGQYGAVTALPLLFEVVDSLPRARAVASRKPASVSEAEICWPLGTPVDAQPASLCHRRMTAWVLDGTIPPTPPERQARAWNAGRDDIEVDAASGQRLSADCARPHERRTIAIARWPVLASPWLTQREREMSSLPPLAPDCSDDSRAVATALHIDGVRDGAALASGDGKPVHVEVRALGTNDDVRWLLDGHFVAQTAGAATLPLQLAEPGAHVLTALAQGGAWARISFDVLSR
ncbi:penicillin-binding protein 1C [Lysobacter sp. TY2-98]|uniref:penicillin-binding protein 1C n=1 Tax=Lysobacter sp. TY2-98 TaxID=2290922 RepID=UPI001F08259F|nr:penicillin-binding protein 1C [Lysobacter sp. TY2-98]